MRAIDTRALYGLDIANMRGLEMGPLDRPKVYPDEGEVYYLDHCSTEDLKTKYPPGGGDVDPNNLMDIHFVADERPLKDLLGDKAPLDYVVASHVIEHVPDLVGWLKGIEDSLRPGGVLALWIPDKRFTWDIFRALSSRAEVGAAYAERRTRPGLRVVMDHFAYATKAGCYALWDDYGAARHLEYEHGPEFLTTAARDHTAGNYIDVHNWVFTPWSFFDLMGWITNEFGLSYDLRWYQTTPAYDLQFMVQLEKSAVGKSVTNWEAAAAVASRTALWPKDGRRIALDLGLAM